MYEDNLDQAPDIIEMTDDEGNTILMQVVDYFFYNGDEYVILTDTIDDGTLEEDPAEIDCYVMHVVTSRDEETGEELETFEPIEDEKLEAKLIEVANSQLNDEEEPEE